jgi:hypothetical protein
MAVAARGCAAAVRQLREHLAAERQDPPVSDVDCVSYDELTPGDDGETLLRHGHPFTGTAIESFPDGSAQSRVGYVSGLREGRSIVAWPSGRIKEEAEYWRGVRHGTTREYTEDGEVTRERTHEYGVLVAETVWNQDRHVVREWRIGPEDALYDVLELSRRRYGAEEPQG